MGFVTPSLLSLCLTFHTSGAVEPGPTFPNGVAALVADMRDRLTSASVEHGDDAEAVAQLKTEGLDALAEDLAYDEQSNRLATVAFAMVQARVLKSEYVGGCPRDMSGCPTSWADQSSGLCEPPGDYDGLCVATDVNGLSIEQKEDFAWKCKASWPCSPSCKLDFETCPDKWDNLNGLCLAPSSYDGICSPAMMFSSFTSQQKAEWAAMCGARWPCA
jgi:CPW-WPC domain-containing protein